MELFQVSSDFVVPSLTPIEKVPSDIKDQNACLFSSLKMSMDPVRSTLRTAPNFFLFVEDLKQFGGTQQVEVVLMWSKALTLMSSCQVSNFPDVLLPSLRRFPYIPRCFIFLRGFGWQKLRPGFVEDV